MRIVFMGTPEFAAVSLNKLILSKYDIVGVFTKPDKAQGRGMDIKYSPVKQIALENSFKVFQPDTLRDGKAFEIIKDLNPDILVVVAYGKIIPDEILNIPKYGAINVHGSLLPKYRGAAPIQWSVINGDEFGGVTTMYLASEMDAGDIIYSENTKIEDYETSESLINRLAEIGGNLLIKTLRDIEANCAPRIKQDVRLVSYAPMLDKSMSNIDFNKPAKNIIRLIYGLQPWPIATMSINNSLIKVFAAEFTNNITNLMPGNIVSTNKKGIEVACANGETILITELQAPGKKRMPADAYLRGHNFG